MAKQQWKSTVFADYIRLIVGVACSTIIVKLGLDLFPSKIIDSKDQ